MGAGRDRTREEERREGADDQGPEARQDAAREVGLRVVRFLGRQRKLFDREVEPDREGEGREHPREAHGQPAAAALARRHVEGETREVDVRDRADPEHDQDAEGQERDRDGEAEARLDPGDVEADEERVHREPPDGLVGGVGLEDRTEVGADADDDDGRRQDVLHGLGETGDEGAPRTHGRACERVGAARVGQCRRHLRDAVTEAAEHHGDDHGRDGKATETSRREPEVPAEEVARDDGADTEGPERSHAGITSKVPCLEVSFGRGLVVGAAALVLGHGSSPPGRPPYHPWSARDRNAGEHDFTPERVRCRSRS